MKDLERAQVESVASTLSARDEQLGAAIRRASDRCFAPLRVQVTGRTGVGKTAARDVLTAHHELRFDDVDIVETASLDVPDSPDPVLDGDVVVHVMAGGVQRIDVDTVSAARDVVVVLAKADTLDDLDGVVRRTSAALGTPVHPLMGTIAASVMREEPRSFSSLATVASALSPEMLLTPDRFLDANLPIPRRDRLGFVESIETFGVGVVVDALAANPGTDDATLRLLLAETSGLDGVVRAVRRAVDGVRTDRRGRLLHELTELGVRHPGAAVELESFLGSDIAVVTVMRSGLRALGESEVVNPTLATAQQWNDRWRFAREPHEARAALAVARGYMRLRGR